MTYTEFNKNSDQKIMTIMDFKGKFASIKVRGKLGHADKPDLYGVNGIYQVRPRKNGFIVVKEKFYKPSNAPSIAQVSQRSKMRTAVLAWQGLTSDEKLRYVKLAPKYQLSGYNLFLSRYMKTI